MKIKIEVDVPEGKYCEGCFLQRGNICTHYNKVIEERIDFIRQLSTHKKCPACLRACEAEEKE